ncbi:heme exporter protein CcmD [Colwellia psychrerythraea]|uniref:Heme exporter protein D n=1 Tax=Colwellia psychrerythraea TaxID=28229 RepID=A0A099KJ62_COLPS|nr:heme exporter protein CcmD [Colwellia psychrerythraea]KGJ90446.1 heme exporter protein CcmD [Colwellia psychrerythraea]
MQFNSFSDFINMGGYGFYVWLSFGTAALILTALLISSKAGHQQIIDQIAKRKQREDKLRQARELRKQQNVQQKTELNEVTE